MGTKITLGYNQELWNTSDTHYNHKNLVLGETTWPEDKRDKCRNFNSVQEMNDTIINNINACVMPHDVLLHYGDVSFGNWRSLFEWRERIHCENIILIPGNHDDDILENKHGQRKLFSRIIETDMDKRITVRYTNSAGELSEKIRIFGNHYPVASWPDAGKGVVHLFGHIHCKPEHIFPGPGKMQDVGVEGHKKFQPWMLPEIMLNMSTRPITTLLKRDHHV